MENPKEIRWKQRFQNFENAFLLFEKAVKKGNLSELERGGLIQFFEITFELSWKTLKDYLESLGYNVNSPRESIKLGIQNGIIKEGHLWMDALDDRNLTTHIYDEELVKKITQKIIQDYYPVISQLYHYFDAEYKGK